ncbi:MAG: enoyl-CoA hydratase-related protein, partial [Solirubrobacteraceae bacterium]
MSSPKTLRCEVSTDGVATIALDQPQTRNALSPEVLTELMQALQRARED